MKSIGLLTNDILSFVKKNKFNVNNDLIVSSGATRLSLILSSADSSRKNV